jgi:alkylresorcinol/alkylpyrone synthase
VAARATRGAGAPPGCAWAEHADGRAANAFESALRGVLIEARLTGFVPQVPIPLAGRTGPRRPRRQGPERSFSRPTATRHHGDREAWERDCERYDELTAAGWVVLRFTWRQVVGGRSGSRDGPLDAGSPRPRDSPALGGRRAQTVRCGHECPRRGPFRAAAARVPAGGHHRPARRGRARPARRAVGEGRPAPAPAPGAPASAPGTSPCRWSQYRDLGGFGASNDVFIEEGVRLGERAVRGASDAAGLEPADVDLLMTTSVTGIAAPASMPASCRGSGLRSTSSGCRSSASAASPGAAGIARVHDYLEGTPTGVAVLLSVELCSLTFQQDDDSTANLGRERPLRRRLAAVVLVGERRAGRAGAATGRGSVRPAAGSTPTPSGHGLGHRRQRLPHRPGRPPSRTSSGPTSATTSRPSSTSTTSRSGTSAPGSRTPVAEGHRRHRRRARPRAGGPRRHPPEPRRDRQPVVVVGAARARADPRAGAPDEGNPGVLMAMGPGFCAELVLLEW